MLSGRIPRLDMPALVVWGEHDRVLPASQAREAVARLRKGSLGLVPDCGHLPQVERPDRFAASLSRFLDGLTVGEDRGAEGPWTSRSNCGRIRPLTPSGGPTFGIAVERPAFGVESSEREWDRRMARERRNTMGTTSSAPDVPGAPGVEREEEGASPDEGPAADVPQEAGGTPETGGGEDWTSTATGDPAFWLKD